LEVLVSGSNEKNNGIMAFSLVISGDIAMANPYKTLCMYFMVCDFSR